MKKQPPIAPWQAAAFTLIEILVSMGILSLLLVMLVSMTDATQRTWSHTSSKVEQFQEAREAFEAITRRLSQATLNTYWDYDNPNAPTRYQRQSELRFMTGPATSLLSNGQNTTGHAIFFQAPLGYVEDASKYKNVNDLLNTWGYFVEFGSDKDSRPPFINGLSNAPPEHYRFRLMELMESSDSLSLYKYTSGLTGAATPAPKNEAYKTHEWFNDPLGASPRPVHALAENIVALVLLPKLAPGDQTQGGYKDDSLAPAYRYDSTDNSQTDANLNPHHQLPPVVQVTMVAVDQVTFARFQKGNAMPDLTAGLFADARDYEKDLDQLRKTLQDNQLNYRVFTSNVSIKAAKWSRTQQN